jgi:tetratricopeptide (TPR) repeat protein
LDYNKALELNPGYDKAYYNRAIAYSDKGEFKKAWEDVHKAESFGYKFPPEFLEDLREASGRDG